MTKEKTCEELISEQFNSRNEQIEQMESMLDGSYIEKINEEVEEFIEKVTTASGVEPTQEEIDRFREEFEKNLPYTETSLDELPLEISTRKVIKVLLSTGGPEDFIEIHLSDNNDQTIDDVFYHYLDWFDGAKMKVPVDSYMYSYATYIVDVYGFQSEG